MATKISLTASDGHKLDAYTASPSGSPKGGVVVIQEIFGVNGHIQRVVDRFARDGYYAVAPALFDRAEKGAELGYDEKGFGKGRELRGAIDDDMILKDVQAAIGEASKHGKVRIIGYCFGGYVAWLAACHADGLSAAACCYGGGVFAKKDDTSKVPVQFHFGDKDAAIPLDQVAAIREAQPDHKVFVYDDAGHGFCCDDRDSFNEGACQRSHARALDLFASI